MSPIPAFSIKETIAAIAVLIFDTESVIVICKRSAASSKTSDPPNSEGKNSGLT